MGRRGFLWFPPPIAGTEGWGFLVVFLAPPSSGLVGALPPIVTRLGGGGGEACWGCGVEQGTKAVRASNLGSAW